MVLLLVKIAAIGTFNQLFLTENSVGQTEAFPNLDHGASLH